MQDVLDRSEESLKEALITMDRQTINRYRVTVLEATKDKAYIFNHLLKTYDYVIIKDNERDHVNIRSTQAGCEKIAELFGGGGHSCAAGFSTVPNNEKIFDAIQMVLGVV